MITLTRNNLTLSFNAGTIPAQGSSDVPLSFVNDPETYTGYTIQPMVGWYKNGCKQSAVCRYADGTITVPAAAFQQNGEIMLAVALIDQSDPNHIEVTQPASAYVIPAPNDPTELPDEDTWQTAVDEFVTQVMQPYQENIQSAIDTATQQQQQIDSAISQMGEYQIVSEDPVQIQFKQGDGTYGQTVDLGDGLASKSMVNAGYYQSQNSVYSGSASDYGIEVAQIQGAYVQDGTPTPTAPIDPQFVEIENFYLSGYNLLPFPYFENTVTKNGITFTVNNDGTVLVNGTATALTRFAMYSNLTTDPGNIPVFENLVGTGCPVGGQSDTYSLVFITGLNGNYNQSYSDTGSGTQVFNIISTGADVLRYVQIQIQSGVVCNNLLFKPMLQISNANQIGYEQYKGYAKSLLSPISLRALPNGVCDTLDSVNVGQITFDGSQDENWQFIKSQNGFNVFAITIDDAYKSDKYGGYTICDRFVEKGSNNFANPSENGYVYYGVSDDAGRVIFVYDSVDSLQSWKTFIQTNPITFWYQLATPTEQDISIPTLKSFYPFTNAWCDSVVQPQITWNALTFGSSTVQNSGSTLNTFDVKGAGFFISQDDESVTIGTYDEWVAAGKPAWPTS